MIGETPAISAHVITDEWVEADTILIDANFMSDVVIWTASLNLHGENYYGSLFNTKVNYFTRNHLRLSSILLHDLSRFVLCFYRL